MTNRLPATKMPGRGADRVASAAELELALEVGAPQIIGRGTR